MLADFLKNQPVSVTVCTATEYGGESLPKADNIAVLSQRLSQQDMQKLLCGGFDAVIDATHPYAQQVTDNAQQVCQKLNIRYIRLQRENSYVPKSVVYAENTDKAAEFLQSVTGNILLSTGSKELKVFCTEKLKDRIYARVLPIVSSLSACCEAGIEPKKIIAMQGPFSVEMNEAAIDFAQAKWLVTKDGGDFGGFKEKLQAAKNKSVGVVVIGRPEKQDGFSLAQVIKILCSDFGCKNKPKVDIVGIGPGSRENMTQDVAETLKNADCLIGAKRLLCAGYGKKQTFEAVIPQDIAKIIKENPQFFHFAVVMSGDTGFFSGTKKLLPLLKEYDIRVLPGISSLVYLCSKLNISYDDAEIVSLHGRSGAIAVNVRRSKKVFALVGGENGAGKLCTQLAENGLGFAKVTVGQRLSYQDESIITDYAVNLKDKVFDSLSAVFIENPMACGQTANGLPDDFFIRSDGEKTVPMTKSEVRAVCLSKLQIKEDSVCWDIGAGTGSVTVEMALSAYKGSVYGVEMREDAAELARKNCQKASADNVRIICGSAPKDCENLPAPTHIFIGGSTGSAKEILQTALLKNPNVRIVATAVSLQAVSQLTECMQSFAFAHTEVVCLNVSRNLTLDRYDIMQGQNPVYIFTMAGGEKKK